MSVVTECVLFFEARLRCSLWSQQDALEVRRLEAEDSLLGLKHRLDQLDSLLSHTHTGGVFTNTQEEHVSSR